MRVLMTPFPEDFEHPSGIQQVIHYYHKYASEFGIEYVEKGATTYDLRASHAGATGKDCDVAFLHGMYWSADYPASDQEYQSNARIVEAIRQARQVTVPSHWVAETFQRDMRFTPHIVPHGIDADLWQHQLPCGDYVLWNKNRVGVDVCDNSVLTILAKMLPEIKFITTFAPHDAPSNIYATGRVPHDKMRPMVQQARVYLANVKETFGIGILEALASGVPVAAYAYGGALDLIQHKVNGYLAEPGDVEGLAMGVLYCYNHYKDLGAAGKEIAKRFTWQSVCEQVAQVYTLAQQVEPPTCAIIIPSYNYAHRVGAAVRSALAQNYSLLTNIVVVDDGSPDDGATKAAVQPLIAQDHRVAYIRQDNNGVAHARNTGIAAVNTKYICCLDADDQIDPTFLTQLIPALEADRSLGIAYSGIKLVSSNGRTAKGTWPGKFDYDQQLQKHNQVPTCCVMRREMWKRLGGYRQRYSPQGAGAEDAEFWLRCGAYGYNAKQVTQDPLFIYSFQTGRVSGNRNYQEVNWLAWHPWTHDGQHPFASVATPKKHSHPVRQYDQPLISVVIPVGPGHTHLLTDALDSLEAQTFRSWEAIVVNDSGSELDITAYPYVRLVTTSGKKGAGYARNRGIEISRAKTFVCLDADDFLQPICLATLYAEHQANPDAWIYSDMYILKESGIIEHYETQEWDTATLWRKGIAPVTCLYTRDQWDEVKGFDEVSTREDWDFHLRLARAQYCGIRVPQPLFSYRHATGYRRDEGSKKREIETLHKLYNKEQLEMACSSCGKRKTKAPKIPVPTPEGWEMKDNPESAIWIEYTGSAKSELTFRGKNARHIYRFSSDPRHSKKLVLESDANVLLKLSYFRKTTDPRLGVVGEPQSEMLQAEPTPKAAPNVIEFEKAPEPTPRPKPEPEPEPEPELVVAEAESEPEPDISEDDIPRPDITVPDATTMTITEVKALHGILTDADQWVAMKYDEQHRTDGIRPRKMVLEYCDKRIREPQHTE